MHVLGTYINSLDYFRVAGQPETDTLLEASGLLSDSFTGGGIDSPLAKVMPTDTVLIRFYEKPAEKSRLGPWWCTPHELKTLVEYSARDGDAFDEGREEGKGYIHATAAVLREWSHNSPNQLANVTVIRTLTPLVIYYGEGKTAEGSSGQYLKPALIYDEVTKKQRRFRQVYLKNVSSYSPKYIHELQAPNARAAAYLDSIISDYGSRKFSFE